MKVECAFVFFIFFSVYIMCFRVRTYVCMYVCESERICALQQYICCMQGWPGINRVIGSRQSAIDMQNVHVCVCIYVGVRTRQAESNDEHNERKHELSLAFYQ